jgi:hypothetical protein
MDIEETTVASGYTLDIPYASYIKLFSYVHAIDQEIGGFTDVTYNESTSTFTMGEVYLIEQEVTGASIDISEEQMARFMGERIKAGAIQLPQLSWHSHVNMGVFFSGTDDKAYTEELKNNNYFVEIVVNKKGEIKAQVSVYKPFKMIIPLDVTVDDFPEIPDTINKEIEKKVKVHEYAIPDSRIAIYNGHRDINVPLIDKPEDIPGLFEIDETINLWGKVYHNIRILPGKINKALRMIKKMNLMRRYHPQSETWLYVDETNGIAYVDKKNRFQQIQPGGFYE